MASLTATITVEFVANFAGNHRVCWRLGSLGAYDCSTEVTCVGGGATCSATISVTVDDETCPDVTFEGYVQATCEDIGSLSGRVPFQVTYSPDQPCTSYLVKCNTAGVDNLTVVNAGSGYVASPAITFTGGNGSDAEATAVIGNGGIKTWTITDGGTGYNVGGSATFLGIDALNISSSGIDAVFDVVVTLGVITLISVTTGDGNRGTGYAISDTFEFANADLGGSGSGAIITVNTLTTGEIEYITMVDAGSGYTSAPVVSIALPPSGTQATCSIEMEDCNSFTTNDCDAAPVTIGPLSLSTELNVCTSDASLTLGSEFIVTPSGCCYDCVEIAVTPEETLTFDYISCADYSRTSVELVKNETTTICTVLNSWYYTPSDTVVDIVVGAACTNP